MTREELIEMMARAMLAYTKENAWSLSQVQGFRYGSDHVVRDCMLPPDAQEVWRTPISNTSPEEMRDFIEQYCTERGMSAALAAIEAAGAVVVPVEATHKMADVGTEARWQSAVRDANNVREIWRAMLAASPYNTKETK